MPATTIQFKASSAALQQNCLLVRSFPFLCLTTGSFFMFTFTCFLMDCTSGNLLSWSFFVILFTSLSHQSVLSGSISLFMVFLVERMSKKFKLKLGFSKLICPRCFDNTKVWLCLICSCLTVVFKRKGSPGHIKTCYTCKI